MLRSIKSRLITGIIALLLLLSGIAATGFHFTSVLGESIVSLSNDITPTIEHTDDMAASLWEQAKVANEIMASENLDELPKLREQIPELAKVFNESNLALKALLDANEHPTQQQALDTNMALSKNFDLMYASHLAELQEKQKGIQLLNDFDAKGALIITALEEFIQENQEEVANAIKRRSQLIQQGNATFEEINGIIDDMFNHDYPVVVAGLELQRIVMEIQDTAGEYLAEEDLNKLPEISKNFGKLFQEVNTFTLVLEELAESDEDKQDSVDLKKAFSDWDQAATGKGRMFDTYQAQLEQAKAADQYTEDVEQNVKQADSLLEKLAASADAISDTADDHGQEVVQTAGQMVGTMWVATIVLGGIIALALLRSILSPIQELTERLENIAKGDGDLTQRVNETGAREIALLGKAFNVFVSKIQAMVSSIANEATQLDESISSISRLSSELSEDAGKQNEEVETVVHSISQVSEAAASIAANVHQCAEASKEADREGQVAKNVVTKAVNSINGLAQDIESTTSDIEQLNTEVVKIASVLEEIQAIAEQTNLLALNAAIEAARAGEQGRGFAVVADEVRTLASRTQNCTHEIKNMTESLKRGASGAVDAMIRSKHGGTSTVEYAVEVGETLNRILESIRSLSEMNVHIATAAEEQRAIVVSANDNTRNMQSMVAASQSTVTENLYTTASMNKSVARLNQLVSQFKV
ncbi:methyl-accepting chemotaxis protein [Vibrio mimicus]|nr:methyl-accepting chemotaxis protein [Vibrio mimicus]QXC56361.1 methyl-accepting chemotaxis protein [Vibrio mimicus]